MITIDQFTQEVSNQFVEKIILDPDTDFRDNDYFDSLTGMSILVMIKDIFDYNMDVSTFILCNTPKDLYNYIIDNYHAK